MSKPNAALQYEDLRLCLLGVFYELSRWQGTSFHCHQPRAYYDCNIRRCEPVSKSKLALTPVDA